VQPSISAASSTVRVASSAALSAEVVKVVLVRVEAESAHHVVRLDVRQAAFYGPLSVDLLEWDPAALSDLLRAGAPPLQVDQQMFVHPQAQLSSS
jgi:hypothetical protein